MWGWDRWWRGTLCECIKCIVEMSLTPQGVAVMQRHLECLTVFCKCNKVDYACLPACLLQDYVDCGDCRFSVNAGVLNRTDCNTTSCEEILYLGDKGITSFKPGVFAGMSKLRVLWVVQVPVSLVGDVFLTFLNCVFLASGVFYHQPAEAPARLCNCSLKGSVAYHLSSPCKW